MKKNLKSMLMAGAVAVSLLTGCNNSQTEWLAGSAAPSSEQGEDGDFYFDTSSKKVYYKKYGVWVEQAVAEDKDIVSIEKESSTSTTNTYKITYADGTTKKYDVNKTEDKLEYTQEELYEEFLQIVQTSMSKEFYNTRTNQYIANITEHTDEMKEMYQTVDENGMYTYYKPQDNGNDSYSYYFKSGTDYIGYSKGQSSYYMNKQEWDDSRKNIIKLLDEDSNAGDLKINNVFTSETIEDVKANMMINIADELEAYGGQQPHYSPVVLKKEIVNQKEQLTLKIEIDYRTKYDNINKLHIEIVCMDNLIKRIKVNKEYVIEGNSQVEEIREECYIYIEYFTNKAIVPSEQDLNTVPTPGTN